MVLTGLKDETDIHWCLDVIPPLIKKFIFPTNFTINNIKSAKNKQKLFDTIKASDRLKPYTKVNER
jgi:hypothetical protein